MADETYNRFIVRQLGSLLFGFRKHRGTPPDTATILRGLKAAAAHSNFDQPIEVTDPIRANPNSSSPWLICLRSAKSEESKRITYSAFFTSSYVSSRYSSILDSCAEQVYHPFRELEGGDSPAASRHPIHRN